MDSPVWTASTREARIQEALDYRRSPSSFVGYTSFPVSPPSRMGTLSAEEEDELEGKAGDSGSVKFCNSATLGERNFPSEEFAGFPITRPSRMGSLSAEEENELEGKAGDSGTVEFRNSGTLGERNFPSEEFATKNHSTVFPGSVEPQPKSPFVKDASRSLTTEIVLMLNFFGIDLYESSERLHSSLELVSILAYLTTFGIIGVVIRYLLEVLFGPDEAKLTSNRSALFIDLPANMLGSFFMGWVGVVFKKDIAMFSEHLAIGLSTGLLGSITTYAAMMQRNLAIMVTDSWLTGLFGLLIGLYLAQMSLVVGEDSAHLLHTVLKHINEDKGQKGVKQWARAPPDNLNRRKIGLCLFLVLGGGLWVASVVLSLLDTTVFSRRTLWVACSLAPPGVWTRWYLARLNGQGIGSMHHRRWFPIGTFLVNVTGSSLEAVLATVNNKVGNKMATLLVGGLNLGTLGCLSTVSTFVVEIQIMHEGSNRWRSYAYPIFSMAISLFIGIFVYGVPLWMKE